MSVTKIRLRTRQDGWEFVHEAEITTYGHYYPDRIAAHMPGDLFPTFFEYRGGGNFDGAAENEYWEYGSIDVARVSPDSIESGAYNLTPPKAVPKQIPRKET